MALREKNTLNIVFANGYDELNADFICMKLYNIRCISSMEI